MDILIDIVILFDILILSCVSFSAVYFLNFAFLSLFYQEKHLKSSAQNKYKVSVLIPAYREDKVILGTVESALMHVSRKAELEVIVIADSLKNSTISKIQQTSAHVHKVYFEKSTKSKSIRSALNALKRNTDYVIILDADNVMEQGCIDELLDRLEKGYEIVQGHRIAKNNNTGLAILDGFSEEINNSIFRKGHRVIGLSASLIGSGFICRYDLLKELMENAKAVGGFDKELEVMLIERGVKIGYAQNAIVYDEKIQQNDAFVNQRRRWFSAQLVFLKNNIYKGFKQLYKRGNLDFMDKLIQFMILPRIITLFVTGLQVAVHLALYVVVEGPVLWELAALWILTFVVTVVSILIAIPRYKYNWEMLKSLLTIPKGLVLSILAISKLKGANTKFIHTKHGMQEL